METGHSGEGRRQEEQWWSPDPRCVLFPEDLKVSRGLRAALKTDRFQVSVDQAFRQVMAGCAGPRRGQPGTWVTPELVAAYFVLRYSTAKETFFDRPGH